MAHNGQKGQIAVRRSLNEFNLLFPMERELLLRCSSAGVLSSLIALPAKKNNQNRIRADFLRFLLLGGDNFAPIHDRGINLSGAWVEGQLNLESTRIVTNFVFANCHFDAPIALSGAKMIGNANLYGCKFPGLKAIGFSCEGNLLIRNCTVDGDLVAPDMIIVGDIYLEGSKVKSFLFNRLSVSGQVCFGKNFQSSGIINIAGARIGGALDCSNAVFHGEKGRALFARGLNVGADVKFLGNFSCKGTIDLEGGKIGQNIRAKKASFDGAGGFAFNLSGAEILGGVFVVDCLFKGEVRFLSVNVKSDINLSKSKIENAGENNFSCDRANFNGAVKFSEAICDGPIRFLGVYIGSNLDFRGVKVRSEKSSALALDRSTIKGNLYLSDKFEAVGEITLSSAKVGKSVICTGGNFSNKGGNAIVAQGLQVQEALFFRKLIIPVNGVNLSSCRVGRLVDDEQSWGDRLSLDGFVYESISGGSPTDAPSRLRWLKKQRTEHLGSSGKGKSFRPQPWKHLRKVLFDTGHFADANEIAVAYQTQIYNIGLVGQARSDLNPFVALVRRLVARITHKAFGMLIGYGYKPMRLVAWMITVWFACGLIYWGAAINGIMAPTNPLIFQQKKYKDCVSPTSNWYFCEKLPEEYSGFSAFAYSLDVLLPVVDLQQEKDWAPMIPTPKVIWFQEVVNFTPKHIVRLVLWFEIIFGWIASLLLIAVVSGLSKRTED